MHGHPPPATGADDARMAASTASDPTAARVLSSAALLQGARAVEISHNGTIYRLQATRLGKLILTK